MTVDLLYCMFVDGFLKRISWQAGGRRALVRVI